MANNPNYGQLLQAFNFQDFDPFGTWAGLFNIRNTSPGYSNNTGLNPQVAQALGYPAYSPWGQYFAGGPQGGMPVSGNPLGSGSSLKANAPVDRSMYDQLYYDYIGTSNPVPSQVSPWQRGFGGGAPFAYDPRFFHADAAAPYMDQGWLDYFTGASNAPWQNPPTPNPPYPGPPSRPNPPLPSPAVPARPGSPAPSSPGDGGSGMFSFADLADALLAVNNKWGNTASELRAHLPGQRFTIDQLRAQMPTFSRQHARTPQLIEQALATLGSR